MVPRNTLRILRLSIPSAENAVAESIEPPPEIPYTGQSRLLLTPDYGEQVFANGFESGDLEAWSTHQQ
jgi:hypothetical protein